MPIGNQKFGIPRKYQYQIGIWYLYSKFLGIFLVFYRYLEYDPLNIWLNIGIFGRIKIGLVFGFYGCHFIGIGLVSVCHLPENGISSKDPAESGRDRSHCPRQFTSASNQQLAARSKCFKHYAHPFPVSHINRKLCYKPHNFVLIYLPTPVYDRSLTTHQISA